MNLPSVFDPQTGDTCAEGLFVHEFGASGQNTIILSTLGLCTRMLQSVGSDMSLQNATLKRKFGVCASGAGCKNI